MDTAEVILIKGGRVVNAHKTEDVDVLIENGVVKSMDEEIAAPPGARVISAKGLLVIPGGIDPHTHLEFEFMGTRSADDFVKGTKAAIAGGTTTIMDYAIAKPGQSLLEVYDEYRKKADGRVCCDYSLHIGLTYWSETVPKEMELLCAQHGVNSFKVFMAYKDMFMLEDSEIYEVFGRCRELGAVPMVHAENGSIIAKNAAKLKRSGVFGPEGHELSRPEDVETEATNRAAMIAGQVEAPLYVVHVMSDSAAKVIADRRANGQKNLFGETLAASLGTVAPDLHCEYSIAAGHVMSPPLRRDPMNPVNLMKRLAENELQVTASDNCTFSKKQKELGKNDFVKIPSGVNGLEDRMSVVWDKGVEKGIITAEKFVEVTSTNAAKIFNLYPKKGCVEIGSDADIVIWNPKKSRKISADTHLHACDFNIFEGMIVQGAAETVIVKGKICYENGQMKEKIGHGKYLPRNVFPVHVYGRRPTPGLSADKSPANPALCNVLNFQERQLLSAAISKAADNTNAGSLKLFTEVDNNFSGKLKQKEFKKVLQAMGVLSLLSSREVEALIKGFSKPPPADSEIDYPKFVNACEYHYQRKQQLPEGERPTPV